MNINVLVNILKTEMIQNLNRICVVNGELEDLDNIQKMGLTEFHKHVITRMPCKLYKYFPNRDESIPNTNTNVNYSVQALKENTVFLQLPCLFDDVYDSDINVPYKEFERTMLEEYCLRSGVEAGDLIETTELECVLVQKITDAIEACGGVNSLFIIPPKTELDNLINQRFLLQFREEYRKTSNTYCALKKVIHEEYKRFIDELKNTFRISCFATTPYSQLMWGGAYADFHQGFCVEYTILPNEEKYRNIFMNLFPVIYCKARPNLSKDFVKLEYQGLNDKIVWDLFFHGVLRKSFDWAYQNEWRLLMPKNLKTNTYCVPFFPITKVFLGNRMPRDRKMEIIKICHERNIPYAGVIRNPYIYEMQECAQKCENCVEYLQTTDEC